MKEKFNMFIKRCKKSILFYTLAYLILFIVSKNILNAIGIEYRQYFNYFSIILILIGIISSLIQFFIKTTSKNRRIYIALSIASMIGIILICFPLILLLILITLKPPEYIVERDNKKYVAYVYSWLDTRVDYYEYINFLLVGKNKRIEDFYNNVGRDVLAKEAKGLFTPTYTTYYDKNGKYQYEIINNNIQESKNNAETIYTSEYLKKYEKDFNTAEINGFIISTNTYVSTTGADPQEVTTSSSKSIIIKEKEKPQTTIPTKPPDTTTTTKKPTTTTKSTTKTETKKENKKEDNFYISNISLKGIKENGEQVDIVLSPVFDKNIYEYTCNITSDIQKIDLQKDAGEYTNSVIVTGLDELKEGENIIKLQLSAENYQAKTYTIKVVKEKKQEIQEVLAEVQQEKENIDNNKEKSETKMISMPLWVFILMQIIIIVVEVIIIYFIPWKRILKRK